MAKGATQETEARGKKLGDQSTAAFTGAISGGGAFGGPGLTTDYNKAQEQASQTRNAAVTGAQNFMDTGGFDQAQLAKLRGQYGDTAGFYKGMMGTGGYTPEEQGRFINQATRGVANTANVLKQQVAQRAAATGGYGGPAAMAQMSRHLGQDQAATTTDALAKIHEQVNANKFKAATGLDTSTTQAGGLEESLATGRRQGGQLMNQLYNVDTNRITDQGKMILSMFGIDTNNQALSLKALAEMAQRPGLLDNILRIADTISPFKSKGGSASPGPTSMDASEAGGDSASNWDVWG